MPSRSTAHGVPERSTHATASRSVTTMRIVCGRSRSTLTDSTGLRVATRSAIAVGVDAQHGRAQRDLGGAHDALDRHVLGAD